MKFIIRYIKNYIAIKLYDPKLEIFNAMAKEHNRKMFRNYIKNKEFERLL